MKKRSVLVIILLLFSNICTTGTISEKSPFRGVWLTNVCSDALDSYENIVKTVNMCSELHINNIFVVTWNRAETTYPSKVVQSLTGRLISDRFYGRDPLKELIDEAHKKGIKVHAWFEFGFSSSYKESDGGIIIRKKPHWASRDINGDIVSKNGFQWMNPFHPEVQEFILDLIKEVVTNYNIDGVQGDDRLPALPSIGGYDEYTTELYKSEHGNITPPENYRDKEWVEWRASLLTYFQGKLYREVKKIKPDIIVSTAPSIHPWAKEEYLQDWPEWVKRGYTDLVIPQVYRNSTQAYKETLRAQLKFIAPEKLKMFIPGVLIKVENRVVPDKEMLRDIIEFNREQMLNGESFFYYEGLNYFYDILKIN
ncbi:MAG: glycoside hydrolase family 10 protein [Bacteroidales bacterium]